MKRYRVYMETTLSLTRYVELKDDEYDRLIAEGGENSVKEVIEDKAFNENEFHICAQCGGWGNDSYDADVGEFELTQENEYRGPAIEEVKE